LKTRGVAVAVVVPFGVVGGPIGGEGSSYPEPTSHWIHADTPVGESNCNGPNHRTKPRNTSHLRRPSAIILAAAMGLAGTAHAGTRSSADTSGSTSMQTGAEGFVHGRFRLHERASRVDPAWLRATLQG
jgi:hypothetical protein